MSRFRSRVTRIAAIVATSAVFAGGAVFIGSSAASAADLPSPAPVLQRDENVATADPIPTVQIDNGYVWTQTTIGTTVYAAGQFANARAALAAPGTQLTPRTNILAFDINTGALKPFAPSVNGVIKSIAASPDGSRIYIGGSFNNVNGQTRWNIAALDAVTGQLVPGFNPAIGGSGVYGLAAYGSTVYAGGSFTQANGTARTNAAAFDAGNGALQSWAPAPDKQIDAMVMDPGGEKVILAGRFGSVDGNFAMRGVVAVDRSTGQLDLDWALPKTVRNGLSTGGNAGKAGIFALAADDTAVYGTGWVFADVNTGNLEGVFAAEANTGEVRWISDCLGDHYGVHSTGKTVYTTAHTHACSTVGLWPEQPKRQYRYVEAYTTDARGTLTRNPHTGGTYQNWQGTPSPSAYNWFPDFAVGNTSGLGQAGLSITGVGDMISVAGEFRSVNNRQFEGIVRFSPNPPGGAKDGPRLSGADWGAPSGQSIIPGRARIAIGANWDRDDRDLTYALMRSGTAQPVATTTLASGWWNLPQVHFDDVGLTPGSTHTYTVVARDSNGNSVVSSPVSVTIADGEVPTYVDAVLNDSPDLYYPLGTVRADWGGSNAPVFGSGVTTTQTSQVKGTTTGFSSFSGTMTGRVSTSSNTAPPGDFSAELWFSTNTNRGGKLIGYGNSQTGSSGSYDRHVYMTNQGRLIFGTYPGSVATIQSPSSYNDNKWHHMVATQSAVDGMKLYVDGQLVAQDASVTSGENYRGYWRIGGDNLSSWPNQPSSLYFSGRIDEVAIYSQALNSAQISTHYGIGTGVEPPTASFTASVNELDVATDGSASTASGDATIAAYEWDFGDGSAPVSGINAAHSYSATGSYTVTLTVRDSRGLENVSSQVVEVLAPNVLPTAAFTVAASGLTATVDASGSSDSDGQVVAYSWAWGDGSADSTGQLASHAYAQAGSYTTVLTVTDDRGGVSTTSHEVVVTHADPSAVFGATAEGLKVSVDASASSAADGATMSYGWDWGDGSPLGTGVATTHVYADEGDYTVTLTVTDSLGAIASVTQDVSVSSIAYAASDSFNRVVTNGWGAADTGGVWAPLSGSASVAHVAGGAGVLELTPGLTRNMTLSGLSLLNTASSVTFTMAKGPNNGPGYVGLASRQNASTHYMVRAWTRDNGTVWLVAQRGSTVIATKSISGMTWAAGSAFHLTTEVTGTNPTSIKAKIWAVGTTEPGSWQLETTDSTANLQTAGSTTLHYALGGSAASEAAVAFDDLTVSDLEAPAGNVPPVAGLTVSATNLTVSASGATSTDSDGSVVAYSWNWGDGSAAASGVTANHSYAAAGNYTVTLTVTDDAGATNSTSEEVTVVAPPVGNEPPVAVVTASASGLTVSASGESSTDPDGSVVAYSWNWGDGSAAGSGVAASHTYAAPGIYTVTLTVTDNSGATHSASQQVTVTAPPVGDFLLRDEFDRVVSSGWGSADLGGAWTISGGAASAASVADGAAQLALAPGSTRSALLNETPLRDFEAEVDFTVDVGADSGSLYAGVIPRQTAAGYYLVHAWMRSDGRVWLVAQRGSTVLATASLSGLSYAAGDQFTLKVRASGTDATQLQAKLWEVGTTEPADWQLTTSDASAGFQGEGSVGIRANRVSSSTTPANVSFDRFHVRPLG